MALFLVTTHTLVYCICIVTVNFEWISEPQKLLNISENFTFEKKKQLNFAKFSTNSTAGDNQRQIGQFQHNFPGLVQAVATYFHLSIQSSREIVQ